jgi:hypothetical protein
MIQRGGRIGGASPETRQYARALERVGMKAIVTMIALCSLSLSATGCYTHSFVS